MHPRIATIIRAITALLALLALAGESHAQQSPLASPPTSPTATLATPARPEEAGPSVPTTVEVRPGSADREIEARLQRILEASEWFQGPQVRVDEGIAFLSGRADTEVLKKWAGDVARNTRDVVAVVNRIDVASPPLWDTSPAVLTLQNLWRNFIKTLPLLVIGVAVLVLSWYVGRFTAYVLMKYFDRRRFLTPLLREVLSRAGGGIVFLLGLYLVLLVVGLARLAITVLGGTGLIGLVIGIAFRDITENFLASIFLSIQRPFRSGDMIEVAGVTGLVQRLTVRTTVLLTMEGNHVQIPNATIYKSTIRNFTSNPNTREEFVIGIGYADVTSDAQDLAMEVLKSHPAILADPEPWVLVDNLGVSTVNLKIYFWLDTTKHSGLKVKSSVIRLVKRAFQENGISIPDQAREVIVSREVPVHLRIERSEEIRSSPKVILAEPNAEPPKVPPGKELPADEPSGETKAVCTNAEGGLATEVPSVDQQGQQSRVPEHGQDLLK